VIVAGSRAGIPAFYDLGSYTWSVATRSDEAQRWFDQGLLWRYGFNHEAALIAFAHAAQADPSCAMARWGIAWASGPFYNRAWLDYPPGERRAALADAHAAITSALDLSEGGAAVERAVIEALVVRYPQPEAADVVTLDRWHDEYVAAMRRVHERFPDDLDVTALFAEAMMNRTPWALWDTVTGQPAEGADTEDVLRVLAEGIGRAQATGASHPALDHFQVHALEMSPDPAAALSAADRIRSSAPEAGHLLHMPTHIDVQLGHYGEALVASERAIVADRRYVTREGAHNFFTSSRCHNLHLKVYAAMLAGRWEEAISGADELLANLPADLLRWAKPPLAHWLEGFVPMRLHVLVRFGKWRELTEHPLPDDPDLYLTTTPLAHYARGVAHSALDQVAEAEAEQRAFDAAFARVPEDRYFFTNPARGILAIAEAMLDGEIAYRRGDHDRAFTQLRRAVDRDDRLPYDEPWGWMQPVRHALGALLLEQGRIEEAAATYRADLGLSDDAPRVARHPNNPWALQGLAECFERLGARDELAAITPARTAARALADIDPEVSCYCRRDSADRGCCRGPD
jgi:tetratricopeptide (TPR) repeat protein